MLQKLPWDVKADALPLMSNKPSIDAVVKTKEDELAKSSSWYWSIPFPIPTTVTFTRHICKEAAALEMSSVDFPTTSTRSARDLPLVLST